MAFNSPQRVQKEFIGVVGLGCIGGSIACALSKTQKYNIIGVDNDVDILQYAFERNYIQLGHTDLNILKDCQVVFVCTPIDTVSEIIGQVYKIVGAQAIITDTASIKAPILQSLPAGVRFVGGHPMAGSEMGGIKAAKDYMFENAYYVLTPHKDTAKEDLERVTELTRELRALPVIVDEHTHDYTVAKISHLPHMAAYSMVNLCIDSDLSRTLAAGGFRDITRIASSPSKMWLDIVRLNKENVLSQLNGLIKELDELSKNIQNDEYETLRQKFESARIKRESIEKDKGRFYSLRIDVKDVPGIIAKITLLLYKKKINIKNIYIENSREGESGGALVVSFENARARDVAVEVLRKKRFNVKTE
ncbi:MAG TPA: prephenate dehydrogenase/arogenate dehydrogenase family protein [Clostridia bacterium]